MGTPIANERPRTPIGLDQRSWWIPNPLRAFASRRSGLTCRTAGCKLRRWVCRSRSSRCSRPGRRGTRPFRTALRGPGRTLPLLRATRIASLWGRSSTRTDGCPTGTWAPEDTALGRIARSEDRSSRRGTRSPHKGRRPRSPPAGACSPGRRRRPPMREAPARRPARMPARRQGLSSIRSKAPSSCRRTRGRRLPTRATLEDA